MADTASLIARVKTEGADQSAQQLDNFSDAAANAEMTADALARTERRLSAETKNTTAPIITLSSATESLGNKIAVLEEAQEKGARSAAILAAQLKLGAAASEEEKNRIAELTGRLYDLNNQQAQAAQATKNAVTGMGGFRNAAQQTGYQLQDLVVQIQGGTSAFVAIGQQGSQLAGAFGPGGAILGAVIALASAIGGVLYKSMQDAADSAKGLQDATTNLQKVLKEGALGALEFTDELLKLAEQSNAAALAKLASSIADANTQIKAAGNSAAAATSQFESWVSGGIGGAAVALNRMTEAGMSSADVLKEISTFGSAAENSAIALRSVVNDLSSTLGVTSQEALGLVTQLDAVQKSKSPEAVQTLANTLAGLQAQYGTTNPELNKFNNVMQEAVVQMMNGKSAAEALQGAYNNLAATIEKLKQKQLAAGEAYVTSLETQSKRGKALIDAQAKQQLDALKNRDDLTEEQRKRAQAAIEAGRAQDLKDFEDRENKKTTKAEAAGQRRLDAAARRDATAAERQKQAAQTFLDQLDRTNTDVIKKTDAVEKQRLEKLQEFQAAGLIVGQQYEDAKTAIQLNAETLRQQELDKKKKEQMEKDSKGEDFMNQILGQNATELELLDIQEKAKLEMAKKYRELGRIDEEEYQQSLQSISETYNKKREKSYAEMLGTTTDDLRTALGEGNKMYKAFAIANAVMNTYQAANAAYQSASAIPIVGWVLGPIAAAAAVAAGLANVSKIRSAREQGGNLTVGQASAIAERGKAEVIVPASASRVRTAQQMRQIMGENSSNGRSGDDITIINQTSGRIDSATTERDDEGRLRVIISETVALSLQDSNSQISQARRATRGQPGYT